MEPRILVLDGNQRASLAAVRSLGEKKLWVAAGDSSDRCMAGLSRFCQTSITYPDPFESPRAFFDDILRQIRELNISFLLPISEATTYVILQYRDELPTNLTLPFPQTEAVEQLANKNKLFKFASEQGIPTPDTIFCESVEDGLQAIMSIHVYPIVLKPAKSRILLSDQIVSTRVITAYSREQAASLLKENKFFAFPYSIQSFVEGEGQGVFALFNQGSPVCYFSHRRLREKPPSGGVSVLSESAPLNESLRASAEKLLSKANWHGVAMVEYRVSEDGVGYLMEVNPRFWGSLQLAIDSGIDFPWWLYLVSTGNAVPQVEYRYRRLRWILGDLDRLLIILKSPRSKYPNRNKLIEIMRFLKPNLTTRHEVNRIRDLKPFLFEVKQYLRALRG
ncbi:ATP-grasp domain-containing protein [Marinobacter salinisoli]|uniref:ATP-grasp domain-containing protein n=1 Tax=Marinobacter salinisoli TaxID=2769486 RepID=A0ABX7MRE0_9GAMM|nr:ATP-grasp domain-containing protein [Marinobacter salinisoli]QSP93671.1 ATP-grasp domain-containing protein [Marinobacter salinisoli]